MPDQFHSEEDVLSHAVIGAAIEVHRYLGPGLLERVYELALCQEFALRRIPFARQQCVPIVYKGIKLDADLYFDLLVADKVLIEVKAKETLSPTDKPQLLTYLRLLDLKLGLLINFHVPVLKNGIHRIVNRLKEPPTPREIPEF